MNNFFQTIKTRLTTESPTFFKYITKFGVLLIGIGTSLLALMQIPNFVVSFPLAKYASYLIVMGTTMSGVSKLTCEDKKDNTDYKNSETK